MSTSNPNPIDDLLKSFDDVVRSADDFWKAVIRNHHGATQLVANLIIDMFSTALEYNARLWLQSEYFRSLREQKQEQSS